MLKVDTDVSFPVLEEAVLKDWQRQDTFSQQNARRKDAPEFAFYDGPPFANGLPHYGHLLANTIKDAVPRYWIMRGYKVARRFGWDCHGLPVEFEIEKREGLRGRPDILKLGIAKFNELCRDSVLHYASEWQKTITRLGRWVDWQDQYRTMDRTYMESVWWVFRQLSDKGLIYQGFKVVPYSPRTSSVVSNFEANQNYKDIQDPAITVKFKLLESPCDGSDPTWILVWTTTPWTLPANLALAVGPEISYVKIKDLASGEQWILAEERLSALFPPSKKPPAEPPYTILARLSASELDGKAYEPLFPYFKNQPSAFRILVADFVTTTDGTGVVHQAPAYGEDDYWTCRAAGIDLVDPIDENGCFTAKVSAYEGQYFKDADRLICRDLKASGGLLRHDTLVHSYPFDERTDTPLMYKAVPSWYVAVEKLVDRLVANNQKITWVPGHIQEGRMGTWLQNARDWAISRNRFWGTPLPVWICDLDATHRQVMASVGELEAKVEKPLQDIHLHHLQGLSFACEHCQGRMHPVDVVFDCWFESGSMPIAQLHYPFANQERFAKIFPADFVAEGLDQTRGWFYTLHVLATALFDQPAFKNVIVNGVILDESGKKMSKRHRNYTPPDDLINKYGADSVRLYMLNSPLMRGENLIFTDKGVKDCTRALLLPLWNALSFLSTYALADGWQPSAELASGKVPQSTHEMDRWVISRLQTLVGSVHSHMEAYKLYLVVPALQQFMEDLTNWYIRLSRRRFWGASSEEGACENGGLASAQTQAYETLYYTLLTFAKVMAPFAPFIAESLYKNLVSEPAKPATSVHLCDFPQLDLERCDAPLEAKMELLQRVTTLARSLRQIHKLKVRQVLPELLVITPREEDREAIASGSDILKSELNVRAITFTTEEAKHVRLSVKPNLKTLGRRLGKALPALQAHLQTLDHKAVSALLQQLEMQPLESNSLESGGSVELLGHRLELADFLIERGPLDERLIATEAGVTVLLDTHLTPELVEEGLARELVNRIQNLRKDSGLQISDRIHLQLVAPQALAQAAEIHRAYLLQETLGLDLHVMVGGGNCDLRFVQSTQIEGMTCVIGLEAKDHSNELSNELSS